MAEVIHIPRYIGDIVGETFSSKYAGPERYRSVFFVRVNIPLEKIFRGVKKFKDIFKGLMKFLRRGSENISNLMIKSVLSRVGD